MGFFSDDVKKTKGGILVPKNYEEKPSGFVVTFNQHMAREKNKKKQEADKIKKGKYGTWY